MAARKIFVCIIALLCIVSIVSPAIFAGPCAVQPCKAPGACNNDAWKKLGRGACNMVTFPFELFNQVSKVNTTDGPMAAWTWGLVKGVGMTGFRALVGVYEVVTFPMPIPEGYKPILTDPEFFFEDQIV
jgi:putative exosortase-associated protein (TIGR04073 family)